MKTGVIQGLNSDIPIIVYNYLDANFGKTTSTFQCLMSFDLDLLL